MIEKVVYGNDLLALILRCDAAHGAIQFFTPQESSLQMGSMRCQKGDKIQPHIHNRVKREVCDTQEVLFVKSGKVRVDFYSDAQEFLESRELISGDIILLVSHGHGFEMLEPTVMVEVKTGPYLGERDKIRFEGRRG